jgi:transcription antitermination factor NusG
MSAYVSESWFAVQVAPRHEKKVATILEYKGYEHFLPTYQSRRKWSDRIKTIDQPMFPGYVFCRTGQQSTDALILTTPGAMRVVGFSGKPYPIAEEEIEAIRRVAASSNIEPIPYLKIGEKVRINSGPMAGVTGILTQIRNRHRLVISVDLIMKSIAVDIDMFDVVREQAAVA